MNWSQYKYMKLRFPLFKIFRIQFFLRWNILRFFLLCLELENSFAPERNVFTFKCICLSWETSSWPQKTTTKFRSKSVFCPVPISIKLEMKKRLEKEEKPAGHEFVRQTHHHRFSILFLYFFSFLQFLQSTVYTTRWASAATHIFLLGSYDPFNTLCLFPYKYFSGCRTDLPTAKGEKQTSKKEREKRT